MACVQTPRCSGSAVMVGADATATPRQPFPRGFRAGLGLTLVQFSPLFWLERTRGPILIGQVVVTIYKMCVSYVSKTPFLSPRNKEFLT